MVGFCEHTEGYRQCDHGEPKNIIKARDIIFIEEYNWMDDFVSYNASTNFASEPQIFEEAEESEFKDEWNEAMNTENNSLIKNGVRKLVNRPKYENVVKCKWIYNREKDPDG